MINGHAHDYESQARQELSWASDAAIDDGTAGYHLAVAQVAATLALAASVDDLRAAVTP